MKNNFIDNNLRIMIKSKELIKELGKDNIECNIIENGIRFNGKYNTLDISDIITLNSFQVIHLETDTILFSVYENKRITPDMFKLIMQGEKNSTSHV